ncbi:scavenger receptor cysteine-rich type 1 protein M130-like [Sebastes fasciatus]|uniref:scavenger receptor cysteine-rich type 1 protein M130-like n=1 Tax=Sebastes fasciatus TaxID=394691 RepID=UPI003D9E2C63
MFAYNSEFSNICICSDSKNDQIYTEDSTCDDQSRETVYLDVMDHLLVLMLLLWSSGLQAEGEHNSTESDDVRLVGGDSRCAGTLEVKHQGDWRPVGGFDWTLKEAAVVCRKLDCGSAVSVGWRVSSKRSVWRIRYRCVQSGSALGECATTSGSSPYILDLTCSDLRPFIIRAIVLPLILLLANIGLYFYCKATRGQRPGRREKAEPDY